MVTARSVELGSISDATWIEAPVTYEKIISINQTHII